MPRPLPERPPAPRPKIYGTPGDSFVREPLAARVRALFHPSPPAPPTSEQDSSWLQEFFGYLGTDTSADLLNRSVGFDSRAYPLTRLVQFETIQNSLVTLHDAGALNPADMDALVAAWGPRLDPQLALMFGALPTGNEDLQNLFVRSAVSYAAASPPREGGSGLAAAAAWVLAETPVDNQLLLLRQIQQAGELPAFIDGATRGRRWP